MAIWASTGFQARWQPSSKRAGPNIARSIGGGFAGNLGPKTSRHSGSYHASGPAPRLPPILEVLLLAVLPQKFEAPTFTAKNVWLSQNIAGCFQEFGAKMQSILQPKSISKVAGSSWLSLFRICMHRQVWVGWNPVSQTQYTLPQRARAKIG